MLGGLRAEREMVSRQQSTGRRKSWLGRGVRELGKQASRRWETGGAWHLSAAGLAGVGGSVWESWLGRGARKDFTLIGP